ncbi:hypothetical protein P9695_14875 [Weizmannia sp. CD-2023]|uniref:hypothetical protein n=1 Tax=Heyndrickxia TaxID=2837504 RepID=UPI002E23DB17|nr:hypothetical protein [Weizmannia sp. CD-2023]MED4899781.1 hypothetical protein [Weizmannia sp. CD-2023]
MFDYFTKVYGAYTNVSYYPDASALKFENDNWYTVVPYDERLFTWCKERGMQIRFERGTPHEHN